MRGLPAAIRASYGTNGEKPWVKAQATLGLAAPRRANAVAIFFAWALPCVLQLAVEGALSFSPRYHHTFLCWLLVWLFGFLVVACILLAVQAVRRPPSQSWVRSPAPWQVFLALSMLVSFGFAIYVSSVNYFSNMQVYNSIEDLSEYENVELNNTIGKQYMDAGRINFKRGARIDLTRAMGFKNVEQYCVAPVTWSNESALPSYDFWVVGLNCCTGHSYDFHCGDYNDPAAHSGIRLMREDQRPFYRLAVEQAEAAYGLSAPYPVLLYWVRDTSVEMQAYKDDSKMYFIAGCLVFTCFQAFATLLVGVLFWKCGDMV